MNLIAFFIRRPVGSMLLTIGIAIAGIMAFLSLPVAPLPDIDLPTINVTATLPGASPQTMGSSVAAPWRNASSRSPA
jgi:multidrug efflux pump